MLFEYEDRIAPKSEERSTDRMLTPTIYASFGSYLSYRYFQSRKYGINVILNDSSCILFRNTCIEWGLCIKNLLKSLSSYIYICQCTKSPCLCTCVVYIVYVLQDEWRAKREAKSFLNKNQIKYINTLYTRPDELYYSFDSRLTWLILWVSCILANKRSILLFSPCVALTPAQFAQPKIRV